MEIKIFHWYYDIMNLYGEYGNIKILEKHLKDQKLKVIVTEIDEKGRVNVSHKEFVPKKPKPEKKAPKKEEVKVEETKVEEAKVEE